MVIAMKAATDSMDMAVFAFCRAVAGEATVLKVEMTDECQTAINLQEKLIQAETNLLANHEGCATRISQSERRNHVFHKVLSVFLSPPRYSGGGLASRMPLAIFTLVSLQMALQWLKY